MSNLEDWARLQQQLSKNGFLATEHLHVLATDADITPQLVHAIEAAKRAVGLGDLVRRPVRIDDFDGLGDLIDVLGSGFCGVPNRGGKIGTLSFGSPRGRWTRGNLRFSVNPAGCNFLPGGGNPVAVIAAAFAQWQAVSGFFTFMGVPVGSGEDIRVIFDNGAVDERFGNAGGILASAAYPEHGNLQFDAAEIWSANGAGTTKNLTSVALHEIGHLLGLSHSNRRGGTMYPYDGGVMTVDAESRDALRNLYGWRPQTRLADRATSDRPALAITGTMNFTSSNFHLHMAWKGLGDDQGIYESDLIDGQWTPQSSPIRNRGSSQSPALASLPAGARSTGLIMAWKGVRDDQGLYFATNPGNGWTGQSRIYGVGSSHRPALADFDGIRMAWKGVDGDQGIYWSTLASRGWSPQNKIRGVGTSASPALVVFNNRLYMFWKGVSGDQQVYYSWLEDGAGAIWQPQRVVAFADYETGGGVWSNIGNSSGPSATIRGNRILLAWKGVEDDQGIYYSLFDGNEFSGQIKISNVGTSQGPGVCSIGAFTHMAWKGVEGDDAIYWSAL